MDKPILERKPKGKGITQQLWTLRLDNDVAEWLIKESQFRGQARGRIVNNVLAAAMVEGSGLVTAEWLRDAATRINEAAQVLNDVVKKLNGAIPYAVSAAPDGTDDASPA